MKTLWAGLIMLVSLLVVGCASTPQTEVTTKLAVQYATMKVIEQSSDVTADGVIEVVDKVRATIDDVGDEVQIIYVRDEVLKAIGLERFSPADRLLIMALVDQVQAELVVTVENDVLSEADVVKLHELLDWVEDAAVMVGGAT